MIKEPGSESFRISFAKEKENKTNCNKLVRVGSYQSDQHLISSYSQSHCCLKKFGLENITTNASNSVSRTVRGLHISKKGSDFIPSVLEMVGLYQNTEVSLSNFNPGIFGLSGRNTSEK